MGVDTFPTPESQIRNCNLLLKSVEELLAVSIPSQYPGFTPLYNNVHDTSVNPSIVTRLRQLHVEIDNAVAAAYGWTDLDLGHSFHETKQGVRYTISEPARREVLARLLKLNHERYAEEVKQGLHEKKKPKTTKGKKEAKANTQAGPSLFHDEEDA